MIFWRFLDFWIFLKNFQSDPKMTSDFSEISHRWPLIFLKRPKITKFLHDFVDFYTVFPKIQKSYVILRFLPRIWSQRPKLPLIWEVIWPILAGTTSDLKSDQTRTLKHDLKRRMKQLTVASEHVVALLWPQRTTNFNT